MDTSNLPEARLILSDGRPLYLVFKTDKGWVGAPGLRKGRYLTDEDVKDGIPYVPASRSKVEPVVERIAVSIHAHLVLSHKGQEYAHDLTWHTADQTRWFGDDEVYELTGHDSVQAGVDPTHQVGTFLGAASYGIRDVASHSPYYHFYDGEFGGDLLLESCAKVWRTDNRFWILQPGHTTFQSHPRVRNT